MEEEETAQIDVDDGSGAQPTQDPTSSKRSSPHSDFASPADWRNGASRKAHNSVSGVLTTAAPTTEISSPLI